MRQQNAGNSIIFDLRSSLFFPNLNTQKGNTHSQ